MAELVYFTLTGYYKAITADIIPTDEDDPEHEDTNPQTKGVYGGVTITPTSEGIPNAEGQPVIQAGTLTTPSMIILTPIRARLDEGRLKLNADQPDVRLVANTNTLGLINPLMYEVKFDHVTFNGADQLLPSFRFVAPATDTVVNIATITHLTKH